jgi:hypothetical protein
MPDFQNVSPFMECATEQQLACSSRGASANENGSENFEAFLISKKKWKHSHLV